jgi:hypothetical protein
MKEIRQIYHPVVRIGNWYEDVILDHVSTGNLKICFLDLISFIFRNTGKGTMNAEQLENYAYKFVKN